MRFGPTPKDEPNAARSLVAVATSSLSISTQEDEAPSVSNMRRLKPDSSTLLGSACAQEDDEAEVSPYWRPEPISDAFVLAIS